MKFPKFKIRTLVVIVCAAVAVISIAAIGSSYREFKHELVSYHRVKLNDPRSEVEYRLGAPDVVLGSLDHDVKWGGFFREAFDVIGPEGDQNTMPKGTSTSDYSAWVYPDYVTFEFDRRNRVSEITCTSFAKKPFDCGPIGGLWNTDREERMLRLGKPTSVTLDRGVKTIRYDDIGLEAWLMEGRIYSLTIRPAKGGEGAILKRFLASLSLGADA